MRRRLLRIGAQLCALGLVMWLLVFPQVRGSLGSLPLMFDVDNSWVPLAVFAELASLVAYTFATRTMLTAAVRPPLQRIMCIDLSSIALGHCLPDGGAAGTALCWRLLVRSGVPSGQAAFAKLAQGFGSALVLQGLLFTSLMAGGWSGGFTRWSIPPTVMAGCVLVLTVALGAVLGRPWFRRGLHRLVGQVPRIGTAIAARAVSVYDRYVDEHVRAAGRAPGRLMGAAAWSAGNWLLDAAALWATLHAYHANVGLEAVAVVFAIACFGTWLPITPSGLGVTEGLMIPALIAFGSPKVAAILGVLTWRTIAYWMPIPLGAMAYGALSLGRPRRADPLAAAD
jgi:uncharacterized protein (TIRG00374 family)